MGPAKMKQTKACCYFAVVACAGTALALSVECSVCGAARDAVFTLRQPGLLRRGPPHPPEPPPAPAAPSGGGAAAVPIPPSPRETYRSQTFPPPAEGPPHNVAVLIHGETFRFGGQNSRSVGAPKSVGPQFEAVETQAKYLFAPLRRAGFVVRLYMAHGTSGNRSLDAELLARYRGAVAEVQVVSTADIAENEQRSAAEKEKWTRTQGAAASLYMECAQRRREDADYFIIIRPDVILKMDVFPLWYEHRSKAAWTFPEWCHIRLDTGCKNLPRGQRCVMVADMIMTFPRLVFHAMWRNGLVAGTPGLKGRAPHYCGHHLFKELLDLDVPFENLSFWMQTGYGANPAIDANPIYRLAGRPERFNRVKCRKNWP